MIPYLDTLEIHADAMAYNPEQEIGCENKKLFFIKRKSLIVIDNIKI